MSNAVTDRINNLRACERGRGRDAERPFQIPWLGWKDILLRLWDEIREDEVGTVAAATAFFILLSLFPALAALVSLYGLVADPVMIGEHLADMRGYVPEAVIDLLGSELQRLIDNRASTLSLSFVVGLILSLWSSNSGIRALFNALNVAYDETEKRSFLQLFLISLGFTIGAVVFLSLLINLIVGIPLIVQYLHLGIVGELLMTFLPAFLMFGVALFGLAVLYRYGPSRKAAKWNWITPGSLLASVIWLLFSILFSWYLSNWANYSATYGSLGAVIGLMMWLYLSLWVVLVGAEINAEIEHQTARDTTVGTPEPMGKRGATMADDIGEARA